MSFVQWDVNYIYLIMEYCGGGDLLDFIRSRNALTEVKVKYFLQQLGTPLLLLLQFPVYYLAQLLKIKTHS